MSFPTKINDQITQNVEESDHHYHQALDNVPEEQKENFAIATQLALENAAQNALTGQQNNAITAQAALTHGVDTLYDVDTASEEVGTEKIYR